MDLALLLRRETAEDDGLEAGVGVLGDRLQTRLDHDLERTAAAKDAGREDAEAHALEIVLAGPLHRVLVGSLQQLEIACVICEVGAVGKTLISNNFVVNLQS